MTDFFRPIKRIRELWARNRVMILSCGCSFLCAALFLYYFYAGPAMDIGPEQPISFSHRLHAGVKDIQCEFCHPDVRRSSFPGIPPVEKCLYCHNYIITRHPEIQKVHGYFDTKTSTPWRKANNLPEHVYFNHERHIKKQVVCDECHGLVEAMDRIKGTAFKMDFCITCHRQKKANLDCWLACHN